MNKDLISIIVSVYNVKKHLPRCLDTIVQQSYRNLEIILVDDGSTDDSKQICEGFAREDNRIKIIHQPNMGLASARNTGKQHATGNYITFVDGDDYLHLDAIKTMYDAIKQDEKYDVAVIGHKRTCRSDEDIKSCAPATYTEVSQKDCFESLFKNTKHKGVVFIFAWGKLYKMAHIRDLWFRHCDVCEDYDFNIRVFANINSTIVIPATMYFYVQREESIMHQPDIVSRTLQDSINVFFNNYNHFLPEKKQQYGHLLLGYMYKRMVLLKARRWRCSDEEEVYGLCEKYEKATRKAYWTSQKISFPEKIGVTLLLY